MNYSNFTINALVAGNNQLHNQFATTQKQLNHFQATSKQAQGPIGNLKISSPLPPAPALLPLKSNHSNSLSARIGQNQHLAPSVAAAPPPPQMKMLPPPSPPQPLRHNPDWPQAGICSSTGQLPHAFLDAQAFAAAVNASKNMIPPDFYLKQQQPNLGPQVSIGQLIGETSRLINSASNPGGNQSEHQISPSYPFRPLNSYASQFLPLNPQQQTQASHVTPPSPSSFNHSPQLFSLPPPPQPPQNLVADNHQVKTERGNSKAIRMGPSHSSGAGGRGSGASSARKPQHECADFDGESNEPTNDSTGTMESKMEHRYQADADEGEDVDEDEDEDDDDSCGRRRVRKTKIPKTVSPSFV